MEKQAQCPNPACNGNRVRTTTIVLLAEPREDVVWRLLRRLGHPEGAQAGWWLFWSVLLNLMVFISTIIVLSLQVPFIVKVLYVALDLFAIFTLLLMILNLYIARSYTNADKVKLHAYRCRRCGYKWASHDPPHEPVIKRLRWLVAYCRKSRNRRYLAAFLSDLGAVELNNGTDPVVAMAYLEEALAIRRELGDKKASYTLNNLAVARYCMGRSGEARGYAEESLALFREQKDWRGIASTLNTLGHILLDLGDIGRAIACFEESLPLAHRMRNMEGIAWSLEGLSAVAAAQEQGGRAARLLGAAQAVREASRRPLIPSARRRYESVVEAARAQASDTDFGAAWTQGRLMSRRTSCHVCPRQAGRFYAVHPYSVVLQIRNRQDAK